MGQCGNLVPERLASPGRAMPRTTHRGFLVLSLERTLHVQQRVPGSDARVDRPGVFHVLPLIVHAALTEVEDSEWFACTPCADTGEAWECNRTRNRSRAVHCDGPASSTTTVAPVSYDAVWQVIADVRDAAPRREDDADTSDIVDALIDRGFMRVSRLPSQEDQTS
jgi:hypothetical protein